VVTADALPSARHLDQASAVRVGCRSGLRHDVSNVFLCRSASWWPLSLLMDRVGVTRRGLANRSSSRSPTLTTRRVVAVDANRRPNTSRRYRKAEVGELKQPQERRSDHMGWPARAAPRADRVSRLLAVRSVTMRKVAARPIVPKER